MAHVYGIVRIYPNPSCQGQMAMSVMAGFISLQPANSPMQPIALGPIRRQRPRVAQMREGAAFEPLQQFKTPIAIRKGEISMKNFLLMGHRREG
jgi:hypothetical protein